MFFLGCIACLWWEYGGALTIFTRCKGLNLRRVLLTKKKVALNRCANFATSLLLSPLFSLHRYHVLDEEGLHDEAKKSAELRKSIELMSGDGPAKASDGMAKSVKVGTGTKAMQVQRRKLHELDATMGAESKTMQAIRSGRSPRGSSPGAKAGAKSSPRSPSRESKGVAPGKMKVVGNKAEGADSKAYQKTMGDLGAELGVGAGAAAGSGAKDEEQSMVPNKGDQGVDVSDDAKGDGKEKEKKHKMISKAEAVQLYEANLKMKREEERAYQEAQAERFHRASKSGKTFDTMLKRAERAHEKNVAKAKAKQAAEEEQRKKEQEERDNARKAHLNKPLSGVGELTWREMQEQQENARKEAAEKRKQELAASSRAPAGTFARDADSRHRQAAKAAEDAGAGTFSFRATDPEMVTARLEKRHAAWLRTLEESKRRANEKLAERKLASLGQGGKDPSAAMEARAEVLASKRASRLAERQQKEQRRREKEQEQERRHKEKLYNQKIPESGRRLTKSAQNRAEIVRQALEEEERTRKEEERKKRIAEKKERQMGQMLKYLVDERERERKEKLPGQFREISDAQMKEDVLSARAEYRARRVANKKRLQEVVSSRPSLMERHEQAVASKSANTKALGTVAKAMGSGDFDLFNEDEALKLGVMDGE